MSRISIRARTLKPSPAERMRLVSFQGVIWLQVTNQRRPDVVPREVGWCIERPDGDRLARCIAGRCRAAWTCSTQTDRSRRNPSTGGRFWRRRTTEDMRGNIWIKSRPFHRSSPHVGRFYSLVRIVPWVQTLSRLPDVWQVPVWSRERCWRAGCSLRLHEWQWSLVRGVSTDLPKLRHLAEISVARYDAIVHASIKLHFSLSSDNDFANKTKTKHNNDLCTWILVGFDVRLIKIMLLFDVRFSNNLYFSILPSLLL